MAERIQPVRGMYDLMPSEWRLHRHIRDEARRTARLWGFRGMATPLVEPLETFLKPLGETSDVVGKEMYTLADRGGNPLVLRPEGTAAVVRAVLHSRMDQNLPLRLFYDGPMFRYDRPQKGRQRQFYQVGVELLGDASPVADAEVLGASWALLGVLGVQGSVVLELNTLGDPESRVRWRQAVVDILCQHRHQLSEESLNRLESNPLRILDSKDPGDQALVATLPGADLFLDETSRARFEQLRSLLDATGIPFRMNSSLVRGLDYYTHTVFEWTTPLLGAQATVLAGGCYHGLVPMMGGPDAGGVGWSAGVERLALLMEAVHGPGAGLARESGLVVLPLSEGEEHAALRLGQRLRGEGWPVEIQAHGPLGKRLKALGKREETVVALVLGEDEVRQDKVTVRSMKDGQQQTVDACALGPVLHTLVSKGEQP